MNKIKKYEQLFLFERYSLVVYTTNGNVKLIEEIHCTGPSHFWLALSHFHFRTHNDDDDEYIKCTRQNIFFHVSAIHERSLQAKWMKRPTFHNVMSYLQHTHICTLANNNSGSSSSNGSIINIEHRVYILDTWLIQQINWKCICLFLAINLQRSHFGWCKYWIELNGTWA